MKNLKIVLYALLFLITTNIQSNSKAFEETKEAYIRFAQNCDQDNWQRFGIFANEVRANNDNNLTIEEDAAIHLITLEELKKNNCSRILLYGMQKQLRHKQLSIYTYGKKNSTLHEARVLDLQQNPAYAQFRQMHCSGCTKNDYEKIYEEMHKLAQEVSLAYRNNETDIAWEKTIEYGNLLKKIGIPLS